MILTLAFQTRTFPLSGKFTKESRDIYDIVYKMQQDCTDMIKAGMLWDDIHLHAHKIAIAGLLALGILRGDASEILAARTSAAFFPHGLGHYLGLDTHDVGGNPNRGDKDALFRYLRLRGVIPAGSVVTVEPGVYLAERGGVRIEDLVIVTDGEPEILTGFTKELVTVA